MKRRKDFPCVIYLIALSLIIAVALAPLGSVVLCSWIADAHGCRVDEGSAHPCMIGGKDRGELLYTMGVLGWLMLITLPAGAVAFFVWLVVLLLHQRARRTRSDAGHVAPPDA